MVFIIILSLLQQTRQTSRTCQPQSQYKGKKQCTLRISRVISANHTIQSYQLARQTERRIKTQHLGASHAYFSKPSKPVILVGPTSRCKVKNNVFRHTNSQICRNLLNWSYQSFSGTGIKEMDTTIHTTVTVKQIMQYLAIFPHLGGASSILKWNRIYIAPNSIVRKITNGPQVATRTTREEPYFYCHLLHRFFFSQYRVPWN